MAEAHRRRNSPARTHGCGRKGRRAPEYQSWINMRFRCFCPKNNRYHSHGGRGITVCERWLSFENFLADMGPMPSPGYSLDRIDNDGNYEPGNCRWTTPKEQSRNTRRNVVIAFGGKTQCVAAWSEETGLNRQTIEARFHRGESPENCLRPVGARVLA